MPVLGVWPIAMKTPDSASLAVAVAVGAREPRTRHAAFVADDFLELVIPHQFDLAFGGFFEESILHDFFRAQRIAAMDQYDVPRNVREVQRFLDRGIAAADDRDFLAAIEKSVAGRARGHAFAHERLLGRQARDISPSHPSR